jgi:hypothetical protein
LKGLIDDTQHSLPVPANGFCPSQAAIHPSKSAIRPFLLQFLSNYVTYRHERIDIMKNNKLCKMESRRAHQFNAMRIRIFLGLCVILGTSFISVRAADTPAQAVARVALLQKMYELDNAQTPPPLLLVAASKAVVKQPGKSAANVTGKVAEKVVTPQTAPAPTTPVAAPAAVAPAMSHLILSLLILSILIPSLLLLKFLLRYARGCGSNQDSTSSDTYNA